MEYIIRPWRLEDVSALTVHADNKKIWANLRDAFPHPYRREDAEAFIALCQSADPAEMDFRAIEVDGEAVGGIGLTVCADVHRFSAELGYWLGEAYWGRGIATGAVRDLCEEIFKRGRIRRIFATPYAPNTASCRVLEKAGFVLEGVLRRHAVKNGVVLDCCMYARVRE